jgi:hypothetical protein
MVLPVTAGDSDHGGDFVMLQLHEDGESSGVEEY